eukprot:5416725-Pyramimonas_sp.AAC.1
MLCFYGSCAGNSKDAHAPETRPLLTMTGRGDIISRTWVHALEGEAAGRPRLHVLVQALHGEAVPPVGVALLAALDDERDLPARAAGRPVTHSQRGLGVAPVLLVRVKGEVVALLLRAAPRVKHHLRADIAKDRPLAQG